MKAFPLLRGTGAAKFRTPEKGIQGAFSASPFVWVRGLVPTAFYLTGALYVSN